MAVFTHLFRCACFKIMPRTTASTMNSMEVVAHSTVGFDHSDCTCGICAKAIKCTGHHICESGNNQDTEQPAEQKERFLPNLPMYSSMM